MIRPAAAVALGLLAAPGLLALDCSEAGAPNPYRDRAAWGDWCRTCGGTIEDNGRSCKPGLDWGKTAGATGGADDLIGKSVEYGARTGDVGGAALGVGLGMLLEGLNDPNAAVKAEQRRRQAQQERAAAAAQQEQLREGQKDRILSQLKAGEGDAQEPAPAADDNPLGLKLGDASDVIRDSMAEPVVLQEKKCRFPKGTPIGDTACIVAPKQPIRGDDGYYSYWVFANECDRPLTVSLCVKGERASVAFESCGEERFATRPGAQFNQPWWALGRCP